MKSSRDALESTIREDLDRWMVTEIPDDIDLWPVVSGRLRERDHISTEARHAYGWRHTRRAVYVPVLCVLLAISGVTVAAAASPAVRGALHGLWPFDSGPVSQGTSPQGAPLYMKPVPHFHLFYPANIPSTLTVLGTGHVLPGGLQNRSPSPFGLTYPCPKGETPQRCGNATSTIQQMFPPAPSGAAFFPAVVSPLVQRGIEAVWFGFHAPLPGTASISMAEWKSSQYAISTGGDPIMINGEPAHLQRAGQKLTVSLHIGGTAIEVQTNGNQAQVVKLIASLQLRNMREER